MIKQRWLRMGQVLSPQPNGTWWASHAAYPSVLPLTESTVRVFFSARDAHNKSSLASVDLAIDGTRHEVISPVCGPLLEPGPRGAFDCDGITVGCIIPHEGHLWAFYLGWTQTRSTPFTNFIGLAIGDAEGRHFSRRFAAPIIGRSEIDPYSVGYPFVLRDGKTWRMWYGSHCCWGQAELDMEHVVREASSTDGLHWTPSPLEVIPLLGESEPEEFAVSRPWVLRENDGSWSMWYARRFRKYRLGYAHSPDGNAWQRSDDAMEFAGPAFDWDNEEQTYPCVFDLGGNRYMLYNGNGYGRTGFGLAKLSL